MLSSSNLVVDENEWFSLHRQMHAHMLGFQPYKPSVYTLNICMLHVCIFRMCAGGSSGVAKEVCKELASRGATVYAGCRCGLFSF